MKKGSENAPLLREIGLLDYTGIKNRRFDLRQYSINKRGLPDIFPPPCKAIFK
jgi:hypothetical protein